AVGTVAAVAAPASAPRVLDQPRMIRVAPPDQRDVVVDRAAAHLVEDATRIRLKRGAGIDGNGKRTMSTEPRLHFTHRPDPADGGDVAPRDGPVWPRVAGRARGVRRGVRIIHLPRRSGRDEVVEHSHVPTPTARSGPAAAEDILLGGIDQDVISDGVGTLIRA